MSVMGERMLILAGMTTAVLRAALAVVRQHVLVLVPACLSCTAYCRRGMNRGADCGAWLAGAKMGIPKCSKRTSKECARMSLCLPHMCRIAYVMLDRNIVCRTVLPTGAGVCVPQGGA